MSDNDVDHVDQFAQEMAQAHGHAGKSCGEAGCIEVAVPKQCDCGRIYYWPGICTHTSPFLREDF